MEHEHLVSFLPYRSHHIAITYERRTSEQPTDINYSGHLIDKHRKDALPQTKHKQPMTHDRHMAMLYARYDTECYASAWQTMLEY